MRWTLGYLLAALAVTFPLGHQLGTAVPGPRGDACTYAWAADNFWIALTAGQSPFWTQRIFYPIGQNLMHSTTAPFVSALALPFWPSHLVLFLGLLAIVALVVAGWSMRLLVFRVTSDAAAAGIAGFWYVISPPLVSLVQANHYYTVVAGGLLPLVLLAAHEFLRSGRRRWLVLGSALAWALVFTDYYVTVLTAVMLAVLGLVHWRVVLRQWRPLGSVIAANVLCGCAVVATLPSLDTTGITIGGEWFWAAATINLADLVIPRAENVLWGGLSRFAFDRPNGDIDYFLGWGILVLAASGAYRYRKRRFIVGAVVAALVALLLACGIRLRMAHVTVDPGVWMPWRWLVRVPSLALLDAPRRFVLGTQVVVLVLAGLGLAHWRRPAVALVAGLAIGLLDYGQLGMQTTEMSVPEAYRWLAEDPGDGVLLELPGGITESKNVFGGLLGLDFGGRAENNEQNYWQTVHRKRRVAGYVSRIPRSTYEWFAAQPVMGDLLVLTSTAGTWNGRTVASLPSYPRETLERFHCAFDIGYVMLSPNPRQDLFARTVERLFEGKILRMARDPQGYALYRIAPCDLRFREERKG